MAQRLWLIKLKRRFWAWCRITARESSAPLREANALLQFLAFPILLYLAFLTRGYQAMRGEIASAWQAALPLLYAIPLFIAVMGVRALFLVKREEEKQGQWFGTTFVYNKPLLLKSMRVMQVDNDRPIPITVTLGEPGGSIELRAEFDGIETARIKAQLFPSTSLGPSPWDWTRHGPPHVVAFLPPDKTIFLVPHCETCNPSIIRVYLVSWSVN